MNTWGSMCAEYRVASWWYHSRILSLGRTFTHWGARNLVLWKGELIIRGRESACARVHLVPTTAEQNVTRGNIRTTMDVRRTTWGQKWEEEEDGGRRGRERGGRRNEPVVRQRLRLVQTLVSLQVQAGLLQSWTPIVQRHQGHRREVCVSDKREQSIGRGWGDLKWIVKRRVRVAKFGEMGVPSHRKEGQSIVAEARERKRGTLLAGTL